MSAEDIRKEVREFRAEASDFRRKFRASKKGGFTPAEKALMKAELLELVKEGLDVLDATLDTINEVADLIESKF